jgi:hypothetical protein
VRRVSSYRGRTAGRGAGAERIDADFAGEVLSDLYEYRGKRPAVAWLLWATLGWFGAHRFYLGRSGTALLMMFTLGGALLWWIVDAFLIGEMVRWHNAEQRRRRAERLPPLELAFMPALREDVLRSPPEWTARWRAREPGRRALRFAGDLVVLLVAGTALGGLIGTEGAEEAIVAILVMIALTAAGSATGGFEHLPVMRTLLRWSHRVRLFYYYNEPKSPLGLLLRPISGAVLAPFRRRARAEVKLYLQLGFVFTLIFLLIDVVPEIVVPLFREGARAIGVGTLFDLWLRQAVMTFFLTYAFATPIGAVLTLHLLMRRTHTLPRLLCAFTLAAILLGAGLGGR